MKTAVMHVGALVILLAGAEVVWSQGKIGQAMVTTTEVIHRNDQGEVASIHTTTETDYVVNRKVTEKLARNDNGQIVAAERVTVVTDKHHGQIVMTETAFSNVTAMVVTDLVVDEKLEGGDSVHTRKQGDQYTGLEVVRRITVTHEEDGTMVTVEEALNNQGSLVEMKRTETALDKGRKG